MPQPTSVSTKPSLRKVFIIMNPNAGAQSRKFHLGRFLLGIKKIQSSHKTKEALMAGIISVFESHHIQASGAFTQSKGHATELAKRAVEDGADAVVAVGGDGTINEVINGMANTKVMLGVIPYGTANVFGLSFNIPMDVELACLTIINATPMPIDLGRINGTYFACMAGVGFDAFVIQKADKTLKKLFGALSYVVVAMWEALRYRFYPILLTTDNDSSSIQGYFLIISNTKYYGGNLIVAPDASPTDGQLDACIFTGKGLLHMIWFGIQMKLGRVKKSKHVRVVQCSSIRIRKFGNHSIHADAEYIGEAPAKITIAPKALVIAAPSNV